MRQLDRDHAVAGLVAWIVTIPLAWLASECIKTITREIWRRL